ncbi:MULTISPECIES: universal stress protein [unclassified Sedimentibacter]|uniref:universal stress protein n=1 Tax=unclassified Sedimentibacter TaxID=2649220 RepID=UPI0027E09568|nr:universal stress protein [Sedimentibacter sp. MB35-C1]WMJ77603.1 universal stress protein [Sedimentibacter sp. MB35-C1]
MKKILVPIDGSPVSQKAAEKAIELAERYNSKLVFIYVVDTRGIYTYDVGGIISVPFNYPKITEELIQVKTKFLDIFVSSLEVDDKNVEKIVLHGEPSDKILNYAKKEKFDLIVMGRRGFSAVKRFFVGSVTQRVISDAPCPVLIINDESDE